MGESWNDRMRRGGCCKAMAAKQVPTSTNTQAITRQQPTYTSHNNTPAVGGSVFYVVHAKVI
jgi:hypothetical protein